MAPLTATRPAHAHAFTGDGGRTDPDAVPLSRYEGFLRSQWRVVLAAMVIGCLLGVVRSATAHHTYTSTVTVFVPPVAMSPGLPPLSEGPYAETEVKPQLNTLDTDATLVRSQEVLQSLKTVHGFNVPADRLPERVTVTAAPNSRVLTIGVRADTKGNARNGARAVARAFVRVRSRLIGHLQVRNRQAINRRIAIIDAELKALPYDPAAQARILVQTRRQALLKQKMDAGIQLDYQDQYAEVLRAADQPKGPDDPRSDVNATSGTGLGLLGGLLLGLVRDRRPRRLRSARDISRRVGLPVLTDVRREGIADAGRRLRNLGFAEDARTVLVTGIPDATADPVAVSVAAAFAYGGAPTTLLRVGRSPIATYPDPARPDAGKNDGELGSFRVETLGADDGDRELTDAVQRAHRGSGVVVISGPWFGSASSVTLAAIADLTFVTVVLEQVTDRSLTTAAEHFDKAGAPPRGIVIT